MANKPKTPHVFTDAEIANMQEVRGDWEPPEMPLLRRLKVDVCRTEARPDRLDGKSLFARSNDAHAAARMAFFVVREVFNFFRQYSKGASRPQYNQIEAHLVLTEQPLPRRLSSVFDGNTAGCDLEQARAALVFLLQGIQPDPADTERAEVASCIVDYFLRHDDPIEGPRFMLAPRRIHGTPCSPTELSDELNRCTRKRRYGFTAKAEIVWVLGPGFFPRPDLRRALPPVVAEAIKADVEVEFIYTDVRPASWDIPSSDPLPSNSIKEFEADRLKDTDLRSRARALTKKHTTESGLWGFISPCNQLIYSHVVPNAKTPWAAEEFLYLLRGYDGTGNSPMPLVSRANAVELQAFRKWLDAVRAAV